MDKVKMACSWTSRDSRGWRDSPANLGELLHRVEQHKIHARGGARPNSVGAVAEVFGSVKAPFIHWRERARIIRAEISRWGAALPLTYVGSGKTAADLAAERAAEVRALDEAKARGEAMDAAPTWQCRVVTMATFSAGGVTVEVAKSDSWRETAEAAVDAAGVHEAEAWVSVDLPRRGPWGRKSTTRDRGEWSEPGR